jgi:predicted acetyltransferase
VTYLRTVNLIKPTPILKAEYLSFYQEWKESNEDMVPWVITKDPQNFEGMIEFLINNEEGINLPET